MFSGNLTSLFFPSRQLLTIIGPFLERKLIGQIFSHNFFLLQQHFREELETCKILLRKQLTQVWKATFKMRYKYSERNVYITLFVPHSCVDGKWVVQKYGSHIWSFEVGENVERAHPNTVGKDQAAAGHLHVHILQFRRSE